MMIPHRIPFFLPYFFPSSLVWRFEEKFKDLYLTFDDGPVPGPTEFVLDVLHHYNVKATFFCIGDNIRKYPDVFARIISEGHSVGNHTFNHLNGWNHSGDNYLVNVKQCDEYLDAAVSSNKLFRPPYGRITRSQIKLLNEYRIIMWDVLSIDYNQRLLPEKCLANTINATRAGSIIVFHDSHKAEKNLKHVLPRFIEHFLEREFVFRKID